MIGILTDPGVGGTFLTWSLHYLAGHNEYYSVRNRQRVELPTNPVVFKNAHQFKPNQPTTHSTYQEIILDLLNTETTGFHTIYFHNFFGSTSTQDTGTELAIQHLCQHADKIVTLFQSKEFNYQLRYIPRDSVPNWFDPTEQLTDADDIWENFTDYFFKESKDLFQKQQLINKWDQREFLALNLRPFNPLTINGMFNYNVSHYALDTVELYNTFDESVKDLATYLEIRIDQDRYKLWNNIYHTWKKIHTQQQMFTWYFDKIINYIINGYSMDLTRFNLDIVQEACIQHYLIYNHNLNFKTWQLEKFTNTEHLHTLLESNMHPVSNYQHNTTEKRCVFK
jgi:hypothetical protein